MIVTGSFIVDFATHKGEDVYPASRRAKAKDYYETNDDLENISITKKMSEKLNFEKAKFHLFLFFS